MSVRASQRRVLYSFRSGRGKKKCTKIPVGVTVPPGVRSNLEGIQKSDVTCVEGVRIDLQDEAPLN